MTSFRNHARGFTVVPNEILERSDLSWAAKGIIAFYLGKPSGWRPRSEHLQHLSPTEGEQRIKRAVDELAEAGYYRRTRIQDGAGRWSMLVEVTPRAFDFSGGEDHPDEGVDTPPGPLEPTPGKPGLGNPGVISKTGDQRRRTKRSSRQGGNEDEHPPPLRVLGSATAAANHQRRRDREGPGPDSSLGLSREFGRRAEERDLAGASDLQETALARNISGWLQKGDTPDLVRQLMDDFLASRGARTGNTPLWQRFTRDAYALRHSRNARDSPADYERGGNAVAFTGEI